MGIFDKAKDLADKADDAADLAREHADKAPGDLGDKVADAADKVDEAQKIAEALDPSAKEDPAIQAAMSALELAGTQVDDGELQALRSAAADNPADMDKQLAFAEAAFAAGERDDAADTLLAMFEANPEWNEGAAKAKLLQIFEAVGLEDPWVVTTRRKLSKLLFG